MDERKVTVWLSLLTGALVMLVIGAIVGLAALSSDVAQLDEQVTALKFGETAGLPGAGARLAAGPTSTPAATSSRSAFKAQIDGLLTANQSVSVTLTVWWSGAADLLYLPPMVRDGAGHEYSVTAASLKAARLAWLEMTTAGQATATFVFEPAPPAKGALTLTFNPGMPVGDAVAPRVDVSLRASE